MKTNTLVVLTTFTLLGTSPSSTPAEGWDLTGEVIERSVMGRSALSMRTGRAIDRGVSLQDGTIEFDLAVTRHRSFAYIQFRMQSDTEYEEIYFRPHKSSLPDAIQYTPVYKGVANWQLYHSEGYTAPAEFQPDQWMSVRLVLEGRSLAVFVGDTAEAQLVVPRLAREPAGGYVAFRSFLPQGQPEGVYVANFANLKVYPGDVRFDFPATGEVKAPPGTVAQWDVSEPFDPGPGAITALPSDLDNRQWTRLSVEGFGMLVFYRHLNRTQGLRRPAVLARIVVHAQEASDRRLNLGFSDEVSVFLNGRLLYYGDDSYSYTFPRRQGLMGLGQAAIFLPLEEGRNELVLAVADSFGGWGLMGQFENMSGLRIN